MIESKESFTVPVWARDDAFPDAPSGWGWVDIKQNRHPCDSPESLISSIRDDRDGSVALVWAPNHPRMILPEELEGVGDALRAARERWTREDLMAASSKLRSLGAILAALTAYTFFNGWTIANRLAAQSGAAIDFPQHLKFSARVVLGSTQVGLALLAFIIFVFIPWYQARKRRAALGRWTEAGILESAPAMRFETWLGWQNAPLTRALLGLVCLVALAQIFHNVRTDGWGALISVFSHWSGTSEAGLVKPRYFQGEWWRLFTAPFLHGNLLHFLMNAAALAYLGKRLEVLARWPHLPLVFLFAACVGGEASARLIQSPTVGASGGLMGWLGFLLVFETLHASLVPRSARRRLAAGVAMTALIGVIGYRYIDNAAHAGGLLAGMLYAAIVFPKSSSAVRPRSNLTDRLAGAASFTALLAAAGFAIRQIFLI